MSFVVNALVTVGTVVGMEAAAVLIHRHVMHGFGWGWHRSHHEPGHGTFEVNDLYGLIFAALAAVLFVFGPGADSPVYWVAVGMLVYGVLYFVVHDGLVHQRWPFRAKPRHPYLKRLVQAHRLHHAIEGRDDCVSFGFLYAPPVKRLRDRLRTLHGGRVGSGGSGAT